MTPQIDYLRAAGRSRLDAVRWRLALWICPKLSTAQGKRELQRVAQDCGASRSIAIAIASTYFKRLHSS